MFVQISLQLLIGVLELSKLLSDALQFVFLDHSLLFDSLTVYFKGFKLLLEFDAVAEDILVLLEDELAYVDGLG